jgi:hypothetical protein
VQSQFDLVKGSYDKWYATYQSDVTKGVKKVSWTSRQPDDHLEEFVISGAYCSLPYRSASLRGCCMNPAGFRKPNPSNYSALNE